MRFLGFLSISALLIALTVPLLVTVGSVQATVHPINSAECAAPPADGTAADTQDPPGISDPTKSSFLQPLVAVGILDENHEPTFEDVAALNGDNGDSHCVFPETTSHGDPGPGAPDEHAGEDGTLPTGEALPGQGPS